MRMQSDRFAREIVAFLALSYAARSRRLNRKPLDRAHRFRNTFAAAIASFFSRYNHRISPSTLFLV
jgi:hypothetical protein